ncbi:hypothetical protein [Alkalicoccobacillus murimartini]|uniref:Uncharacterized protein n=1 Tax=Alkalicoccobacillus murimartini TaxID=171685 RepID=A0ABT9YE12_9BACI|nr:hypothetical protein [Alkalicoccobacillus murimartini]MDQ0206089.1 hypothetical protein [Alkalicoccobacillus murimartini]
MDNEKDDNLKDRIYNFLEKYIIFISNSAILFLLTINKILLITTSNYGSNKFDEFFIKTLASTLNNKDGTLITLAAVFIGIYFTIFTLLGSLKVDSSFSILTKENFEKLIIFIRNAFIGSFLYLLYSLFIIEILEHWIINLFGLLLLIYMLLGALRFGTIIYIIFNKDVKKYYNSIEEAKVEKKNQDYIFNELKIFLEEQKTKKQNEKAMIYNNLLKKQQEIDKQHDKK